MLDKGHKLLRDEANRSVGHTRIYLHGGKKWSIFLASRYPERSQSSYVHRASRQYMRVRFQKHRISVARQSACASDWTTFDVRISPRVLPTVWQVAHMARLSDFFWVARKDAVCIQRCPSVGPCLALRGSGSMLNAQRSTVMWTPAQPSISSSRLRVCVFRSRTELATWS
jgi:hypothetical protein